MNLGRTVFNVDSEKSFKIYGCKLKIEGHAGRLNIFYQKPDGEAGYVDLCSSSDGEPRRLFYTFFKDRLVKKEGCSGCSHFRGVES